MLLLFVHFQSGVVCFKGSTHTHTHTVSFQVGGTVFFYPSSSKGGGKVETDYLKKFSWVRRRLLGGVAGPPHAGRGRTAFVAAVAFLRFHRDGGGTTRFWFHRQVLDLLWNKLRRNLRPGSSRGSDEATSNSNTTIATTTTTTTTPCSWCCRCAKRAADANQ